MTVQASGLCICIWCAPVHESSIISAVYIEPVAHRDCLQIHKAQGPTHIPGRLWLSCPRLLRLLWWHLGLHCPSLLLSVRPRDAVSAAASFALASAAAAASTSAFAWAASSAAFPM